MRYFLAQYNNLYKTTFPVPIDMSLLLVKNTSNHHNTLPAYATLTSDEFLRLSAADGLCVDVSMCG